MNPWQIVADFERAVAAYTGAPEAVAVNSCTNALFLALRWMRRQAPSLDYGTAALPTVSCPRRTYVSVPMQVRHVGFPLAFRDEPWQGAYRLDPLPIWDAAKRFRAGMFGETRQTVFPLVETTMGYERVRHMTVPAFVCVSFHAWKILGIGQGGAVLTDGAAAAAWMRRMRYDGRTPGAPLPEDAIADIGWHCPMSPAEAALGLYKLQGLPARNDDQPTDPDYPDCAALPCFAGAGVGAGVCGEAARR